MKKETMIRGEVSISITAQTLLGEIDLLIADCKFLVLIVIEKRAYKNTLNFKVN